MHEFKLNPHIVKVLLKDDLCGPMYLWECQWFDYTFWFDVCRYTRLYVSVRVRQFVFRNKKKSNGNRNNKRVFLD